MDKDKTAVQPSAGTWANLPTEPQERYPKVDFQVNKPVDLVFLGEPREFQGEYGAYYIFDVEEAKERKVVMTAAWTLLRALKMQSPLAGKFLKVTKKIEKSKQVFEVKWLAGGKA